MKDLDLAVRNGSEVFFCFKFSLEPGFQSDYSPPQAVKVLTDDIMFTAKQSTDHISDCFLYFYKEV